MTFSSCPYLCFFILFELLYKNVLSDQNTETTSLSCVPIKPFSGICLLCVKMEILPRLTKNNDGIYKAFSGMCANSHTKDIHANMLVLSLSSLLYASFTVYICPRFTSSITVPFIFRCLEDCSYNFKRALHLFVELHKIEKIPDGAFTDVL